MGIIYNKVYVLTSIQINTKIVIYIKQSSIAPKWLKTGWPSFFYVEKFLFLLTGTGKTHHQILVNFKRIFLLDKNRDNHVVILDQLFNTKLIMIGYFKIDEFMWADWFWEENFTQNNEKIEYNLRLEYLLELY